MRWGGTNGLYCQGGLGWKERTKQDRKETPSGVKYLPVFNPRYDASLNDTATLWDDHRPPATDIEALMQPGAERVSQETLGERWDDIQVKITAAGLTEKENAVIEYVVFGSMSLADAGRWLGLQFRENGKPYTKTMVSKLRDSALSKLKEVFENETSN